MKMANTMKTAVIGAGGIGKVRIECILSIPGVELSAVSDPYIENSKAWLEGLGIPRILTSHEDILSDSSIRSVILAVPSQLHANMIEELARAGKDIFCEKPVDNDLQKAIFAVRFAEEKGVRLHIGFNRRFDHNFSAVKKEIDKGRVGKIFTIKIISRDPYSPGIQYMKDSGGLFVITTIHDFDMIRFLTSSAEVEEIFAYGSNLTDPGLAEISESDVAFTSLKMKDGSLGLIENVLGFTYGYDQRVEVIGEKGALSVRNDYPSSIRFEGKEGSWEENPHFFYVERYAEAYKNEMKAFFDAIQKDDAPPPTTGRDGLEALILSFAAQKSRREARSVRLSEFKKEIGI